MAKFWLSEWRRDGCGAAERDDAQISRGDLHGKQRRVGSVLILLGYNFKETGD